MTEMQAKLGRISGVVGLVLVTVIGAVSVGYRTVQAETVPTSSVSRLWSDATSTPCPIAPIPLTPALDLRSPPYAIYDVEVSHTVQSGETLYCIAQRHRITGQAIALANGLLTVSEENRPIQLVYFPDQTLAIPYTQVTRYPVWRSGPQFGWDSGVALLVITYPKEIRPGTEEPINVLIEMPEKGLVPLPDPDDWHRVPPDGVNLSTVPTDEDQADCSQLWKPGAAAQWTGLSDNPERRKYCALIHVSSMVQVSLGLRALELVGAEQADEVEHLNIYVHGVSEDWIWKVKLPDEPNPSSTVPNVEVRVYGTARDGDPGRATWKGFFEIKVADLPTATPTATSTGTPTVTPTATSTGTPTVTPTATPTATSEAPTATPTATSTGTPTVTPIATSTGTPTVTPTATSTGTPTVTPTATPRPKLFPGILEDHLGWVIAIGGLVVVLVGIIFSQRGPRAERTPGPGSGPDTPSSPPKVFISYAREDEEYKDKLMDMLDALVNDGVITIWEDRQIGGGEEWREAIEEAIQNCDLALLLVSRYFLDSTFIRDNELTLIRAARAARGDRLRVVPIIVRECEWQENVMLSDLQAIPRDGRPLLSFRKSSGARGRAWVEIVEHITKLVRPEQKV